MKPSTKRRNLANDPPSPSKDRHQKKGRLSQEDKVTFHLDSYIPGTIRAIVSKGAKLTETAFKDTGVPNIVKLVTDAKRDNLIGTIMECAFPLRDLDTVWTRVSNRVDQLRPTDPLVQTYRIVQENQELLRQVCTFVSILIILSRYLNFLQAEYPISSFRSAFRKNAYSDIVDYYGLSTHDNVYWCL